MGLNKDDLTGREIRILVTALQSHSDTLEEMANDPNYEKNDGNVQMLVADIVATDQLLAQLKRRRRG